jgi:carboxyl-terminal processing protease
VQNALVGTPAFEKGLEQGDKILKINDESTEKLTLKDAVNRLRGKIGEPVRMTILHPGAKDPVEVTITRAKIKINAVLGDRRRDDDTWDYVLESDPEFGYIRITQFGEKTFAEFQAALEQCREKHVKGLILDLRGNPGGLLEAAKDVCDQFVKQGVIVRTKDRDQKIIEEYQATGSAPYPDLPLVVLIDGDSASASEIVAACLEDHDRAVIAGQRSYGKGTVQTPIELEGGKSIMRLTIAGFWRPNDQNIHRRDDAKETDVWGVSPTKGYEVKLDDERRLELAKQRRKRDSARPGKNGAAGEAKVDVKVDDPVIDKALEYLREKTGVAKPEVKAA